MATQPTPPIAEGNAAISQKSNSRNNPFKCHKTAHVSGCTSNCTPDPPFGGKPIPQAHSASRPDRPDPDRNCHASPTCKGAAPFQTLRHQQHVNYWMLALPKRQSVFRAPLSDKPTRSPLAPAAASRWNALTSVFGSDRFASGVVVGFFANLKRGIGLRSSRMAVCCHLAAKSPCRASPPTHEPTCRGISSVGRASGWQPEGQGFESPILPSPVLRVAYPITQPIATPGFFYARCRQPGWATLLFGVWLKSEATQSVKARTMLPARETTRRADSQAKQNPRRLGTAASEIKQQGKQGQRVKGLRLFQTALPHQHTSRHSGWGGIRTPGARKGSAVFKTAALDHSATHPKMFVSALRPDRAGLLAAIASRLLFARRYNRPAMGDEAYRKFFRFAG